MTVADVKKQNRVRARKIERHLRPASLPVGVKFWKKGDTIPPEAGHKPSTKFTWCEYVSFIRNNGADDREILLIRLEDVTCTAATALLGLEPMSESLKKGELLGEIHFETKELAASAFATTPRVPFSTEAITIGALEDLPVEPDVIVMAITPGQTNKVCDGAMWYTGGSFKLQYANGCGICGNATAEPLTSDQLVTIAFCCHGARRWGGFQDDELACGVRIENFDAWIEGMENTWLTGHSYPIAHQLASPNKETHHTRIPGKSYAERYPYDVT